MLKVFKSCNHQTPKVLNSLQKANKQDGKDAIKSCNHHTPKVLNSLQKAIKKDSKRLEVHLRYIWGHLATAYGHLATRTFPPPGGEGGVRTFKLPKGMNQGPLISGSQKQSLPPCPYIYIFDYGIVSWAFNCKKHLGNPPRYGALKGGWSYKDDPEDTQRSQGEAETNKPAKSRWSFFFAQFFVLFFVLFWLLILFLIGFHLSAKQDWTEPADPLSPQDLAEAFVTRLLPAINSKMLTAMRITFNSQSTYSQHEHFSCKFSGKTLVWTLEAPTPVLQWKLQTLSRNVRFDWEFKGKVLVLTVVLTVCCLQRHQSSFWKGSNQPLYHLYYLFYNNYTVQYKYKYCKPLSNTATHCL